MDKTKLKRAIVLSKTIEVTKTGLANLKKLQLEIQNQFSKRQIDNTFDDGLYSLYIGVNSDLSGHSADLVRYGGNVELLYVIIETLGNQLDAYEAEFESM